MRDGAMSHTTDLNINFLIDKFQGRVISRPKRTPCGPNLNLFDSFVLEYFQDQLCCIEQESIPELQGAVEDDAATIPTQMPWDAAQNVRKRAQACLKASGGHLKHFVRSI